MVRKRKADAAPSPDSAGAPAVDAPRLPPDRAAKPQKRAAAPADADAKAPKRAKRAVEPAPPPTRRPTLAVALPGSAVDNAQSPAAAAALAGALARAMAVFCVDEVVVFDDRPPAARAGGAGVGAGAALLARVLQFMETPQYLRR